MKHYLNTITALCLLLLFAACEKKPEPDVLLGEPVFFVEGEQNGTAFRINAGDEDYYMFSSFSQDFQRVYAFNGHLRRTTADSARERFRFAIRDFQPTQPSMPVDIHQALRIADYNYGAPLDSLSITRIRVNFQANAQGQPPFNYFWDFGDNTFSTLPNPSHVYRISPIQPTFDFNVSLQTVDSNNCNGFISNNLDFNTPCFINYSYTNLGANTVAFNANAMGIFPFSVRWEVDTFPNITAQGLNPIVTFPFPGVYRVCVEATDTQACSARHCGWVQVGSPSGGFFNCAANYGYDVVADTTFTLQLSRVNIAWNDADGVEYRTSWGSQPASSFYRIQGVEDYLPNDQGHPTKRLEIHFDCMLYSIQGTAIRITNGRAFIAVAHP